eukprot:661980_1
MKYISSTAKQHRMFKSRKIEYDVKLMNLCKKGKLSAGIDLVNEMRHKNVPLSHYTLSALLRGCIDSGDYKKYRLIWNQFTKEYKIKSNHISYLQGISAA